MHLEFGQQPRLSHAREHGCAYNRRTMQPAASLLVIRPAASEAMA
jgi:hypothetical protein